MMSLKNALYFGEVVHQRFRPLGHRLKYRVASLLVDVDTLATGPHPRLFSHNRFNLFSVHPSPGSRCARLIPDGW
jgi:uncharacterized protein